MIARREHWPVPPPEMRLLLAACHIGPAPPEPPEGPFDAALLVRLSAFHRVSALLHERRNDLPLPEDALDPLRRAALATLHHNLQLALEVKSVLRALAAAGAPVMLLKGIHLMDAVYGSPAHRPLSDVDILIHPRDLRLALAAVGEMGYRAEPNKAAFGLAADREIRLIRSGDFEVALDLHTDLNRPARHHWFPMEALWERSTPIVFEGEAARALCPVDNLTFLCAHAVPHAFAQLIWLCDIARLVSVAPVVAEELAIVARAARAARATWAGLILGKNLLGAPVDGAVLEALEPRPSRARERMLDPSRLFGGMDYSTLGSLHFRAALADSNRDAASILAATICRKALERLHGLSRRKARS